MKFVPNKYIVALTGGLFFASLAPAFAQSKNGEPKSDQQPSAEDKAKEQQAKEAQERAKRELEEAAKLPKGAGQPECLWLGRRVTSFSGATIPTPRSALWIFTTAGVVPPTI